MSASAAENTFTNPVATTGADPWVIQHGGRYYYCTSHGGGGIFVAVFDRLTDLGRSRLVNVWTPPHHTNWSREIWAPELHYLRGKWYVYVAADDGDNQTHRMYV